MLDFDKWTRTLEDYASEIDLLDKRIVYRKMEIGCAEPTSPCRRLTEQQEDRVEDDPIIRDLRYMKDSTIRKMNYVKAYGELPPEVEENADP